MATTNSGLLAALSEFAGSVPGMAKSASIGDNTPDGTKPASEGSRSAENTSDVKAEIPLNVNGTDAGPGSVGGQNTATNSIGTNKTETGKDVPGTKSTKDDPGTSHPAKAGPNGNGSGKEAGANEDLIDLANSLMADIAVYSSDGYQKQASGEKQAAKPPVAPPATTEPKDKKPVPPAAPAAPAAEAKPEEAEKAAADKAAADENLGLLIGQFLATNVLGESEKTAEAQQAGLVKYAEDLVNNIVAQANTDAQIAAEVLAGYVATKQAQAGGDQLPPPVPAADISGAGPAAGGDPAAMGGDPAAMGGDPAAMGGGMPGGGGAEPDPQSVQLAAMLLSGQITADQILGGMGEGSPEAGGPPAAASAGGSPDVAAAASADEGSTDNAGKDKASDSEGGEKKATAEDLAKMIAEARKDPRLVKIARQIQTMVVQRRAAKK